MFELLQGEAQFDDHSFGPLGPVGCLAGGLELLAGLLPPYSREAVLVVAELAEDEFPVPGLGLGIEGGEGAERYLDAVVIGGCEFSGVGLRPAGYP